MKKIVLTGYMASGKTTIGKEIAKKLDIPFFDLDRSIELEEHLTVAQIFKLKGEVYFRKKEHAMFTELLKEKSSCVLSLGGGTPCYANNHLLLQAPDVVSVYLKASIQTIVNRLQHSNERPLLTNVSDLTTFVAQHVFERNYYYNFAKYKVKVDDRSVQELTNEIVGLIDLT